MGFANEGKAALPQPKDVNVKVNWDDDDVRSVSALQDLSGTYDGVTPMQWSFSLVESLYPSRVFKAFSGPQFDAQWKEWNSATAAAATAAKKISLFHMYFI